MTKVVLNDLVDLENQTSAINTINVNNAVIEAAFENTLSRDGTSPNFLSSNLNMNSNRIFNLRFAATPTEPTTLGQVMGLITGSVANPPASTVTFPGTGGLTRPVVDVLRELPTSTDYSTITNAVSAIASTGGGVLRVAGGTTFQTLPSSFNDVLIEYDGPANLMPYASGVVTGMGSLPTQKLLRTQPYGPHTTTAKVVLGLECIPFGSGVNGPNSSDIAMHIINAKQNWMTTTQAGEVDGIIVSIRQGGPLSVGGAQSSDCSAFGCDVRQMTKTGAIEMFEGGAFEIDTDGSILKSVNLIYGLISSTSPGPSSAVGYRASMIVGTGDYAFFTQELNPNSSSQWVNHFSASIFTSVLGVPTSNICFNVAHDGTITGNGLIINGIVNTQPSLLFQPSSGASQSGKIYQQANNLFIGNNSGSNRLRVDLASGVVDGPATISVTSGYQVNGSALNFSNISGTLSVASGGTNYTGVAWTSYTPTVTGTGGTYTSTGTSTFLQIGKIVFVNIALTLTVATGTPTLAKVSYPTTPIRTTYLSGRDEGTGKICVWKSTDGSLIASDGTTPAATGTTFNFTGSYETT